MNAIDIRIHSKNSDITTYLFGSTSPSIDTAVNLGNQVSLHFEREEIRRGFVETEFLLQLMLSVPVSIASSVAASYIYDKLKSHLSKGDTISIGGITIQVEGLDELQATLTDILEEVRKIDPTEKG